MQEPKFDPLKTVLTITVGFLVIYFITGWQWSVITSLIIGITGLFSKKISEIINFLWIKLTWVLSFIIPNIVLALIYYLFLVPIAFISRIFSKRDELMIRNQPSSTFTDINKIIDGDSMKKMW